jgi:hypothetical protein
MSTCYQCYSIAGAATDGIGVCQICNSLACGAHGGLPGTPPRPTFWCSRCVPSVLATSAGGSPPPGPPPAGGGPGVGPSAPSDPGGAGGGAAEPDAVGDGAEGNAPSATFASSFDFELKMPELAQASLPWRGRVDITVLRDAVRMLFSLRDSANARGTFVGRVDDEVAAPIRDAVERQLAERQNSSRYWEERGGEEAAVEAERSVIRSRVASWLDNDLEQWMRTVLPVLDENVWVGARDEVGGVIDLLLLADAVGVFGYSWNIVPERSPFSRLDVVAGAQLPLLVVAELYAQGMPVYT